MAPKKDIDTPKTVYFGRPGNNLKIGIVGLPNVGKSTFFNALTLSSASAENYPFCTLDPEESRAKVPDPRFDWLCDLHKPANKVPAYLTVIDIAGLVRNAAAGEGLGNAFLSHIRSVDAIYHMVRAFANEEIAHVEGDVNPIRDMEIIHNELRLKDVEHLQKAVVVANAAIRTSNDKTKKFEAETIEKALKHVEAGNDVRNGVWTPAEIVALNPLQLLTTKSVIYLVNISEHDLKKKKNKWLVPIKEWIEKNSPGSVLIPFSAGHEASLQRLANDQERKEYEESTGMKSCLNRIITTGYASLDLIRYFTAGTPEVRAWTIRRGIKAPQAAGVIHTDFERGFIAAEVIKYEDMVEHKTEPAVKAAGKYLLKGRDYVVADGDIIHFKFNVTAKKK